MQALSKHNPSIEELDISRTSADDAFAASSLLSFLSQSNELKFVNLGFNSALTDNTIKALENAIRDHKSLIGIDLKNCKGITDVSIPVIRSILLKKGLKMRLFDTKINHKQINYLNALQDIWSAISRESQELLLLS